MTKTWESSQNKLQKSTQNISEKSKITSGPNSPSAEVSPKIMGIFRYANFEKCDKSLYKFENLIEFLEKILKNNFLPCSFFSENTLFSKGLILLFFEFFWANFWCIFVRTNGKIWVWGGILKRHPQFENKFDKIRPKN